jgi:NFU1 iron-sulfur cluster scaffold homolog, mitochondrial
MSRTQEEIVKSIVETLENYVAPAVAQHGGVVNFVNYENGHVLLELSGACSGCAGSTATLKYGVEHIIKEMVPEVTSVEGMDDPFSDVDPFMTDPFGMHNWDLINIEDRTDESNKK